jgi:hypothetical protein
MHITYEWSRDGGSGPVAAIQGPVLDGFGEVWNGQVVCSVQVGYGASDLQDAIVSARSESLLLHCALEKAFGVGAEFTVSANLAGRHLRVGEDVIAGFFEPVALAIAGGEDSGSDFGGALSGSAATQLLILNGWNLYVDIDAVEERPGNFCHIALNHGRSAHALA